MKTYLDVVDGIAVGGIYSVDASVNVPSTWIEVNVEDESSRPGVGWTIENGTWIPPVPEEDKPMTTRELIQMKKALIQDTQEAILEYIEAKDLIAYGIEATLPMTEAQYKEWLVYRKNLRDWDVSASDTPPSL